MSWVAASFQVPMFSQLMDSVLRSAEPALRPPFNRRSAARRSGALGEANPANGEGKAGDDCEHERDSENKNHGPRPRCRLPGLGGIELRDHAHVLSVAYRKKRRIKRHCSLGEPKTLRR